MADGQDEGRERALLARARLEAQARPIPVQAKAGRREVVIENTSVGAGKDKEDRLRALTLTELVYAGERRRQGDLCRTMTFAMVMAGDRYRELYLDAHGSSVGVSSYGQSPGGSVPWARSGTSDQRLKNRGALEDARFAMCGLINEDGQRVLDKELVNLIEPALVETVDVPTQASIGARRTGYSPTGKQVAAAGGTILTEALRRLVLYFGLERER